MTQPVVFEGRSIGEIYIRHEGHVAKTVYRTYRKPEHFCVKHRGFGLTIKIFNYLQDMGVTEIEVFYDGSREWSYRIGFEKFGVEAVADKLGDFEPQLFVPVSKFETKKRGG